MQRDDATTVGTGRPSVRLQLRVVTPIAFVLGNAIAFWLLRPDVPDLWAARARAFAAAHGVGLTYWFSWFGGSTPGGYSVITPYLCAALGTELVAGLAAVCVSALTTALVRGTSRPVVASSIAGFGTVINLWSGRVPFLVGSAFGVAALVFVRRKSRVPAAGLAVLAALASPVVGAFVGLGLSGLIIARTTREYRAAIVSAAASSIATLVVLAIAFGSPGPEPFRPSLVTEIVIVLALMFLAAPPDYLRVTLFVSAAATLLLFVVPNGLGANVARLALFCLPVAVVAVSRRTTRTVAVLTLPIVVLGALSSTSAVVSATRPSSSAAYYTPLASELDGLPDIGNHRLELVSTGHAAYAALLDHAVLARGWETQQDLALNRILLSPTLDTRAYRTWLDDHAVGYIALSVPSEDKPEVRVIAAARQSYLRELWSSSHWVLYEVVHPTAIVSAPSVLMASTPSKMTIEIPCACRVLVRVRWSAYLGASAALPPDTSEAVEDSYRAVLTRDPSGWTTVTTNRPGTYVLAGSDWPV